MRFGQEAEAISKAIEILDADEVFWARIFLFELLVLERLGRYRTSRMASMRLHGC